MPHFHYTGTLSVNSWSFWSLLFFLYRLRTSYGLSHPFVWDGPQLPSFSLYVRSFSFSNLDLKRKTTKQATLIYPKPKEAAIEFCSFLESFSE